MKSKQRLIEGAQKGGKTAHFATPLDLCHLNSELVNKFQKHKVRDVFQRFAVLDDLGSYAVSTEQGSIASHVTAATVLYVITVLPGCAGEASDGVSA